MGKSRRPERTRPAPAAPNNQTASELLSGDQGAAAGGASQPPPHPRWVRVNTLKASVDWALQQLRADPATAAAEVGGASCLPHADILATILHIFDRQLQASTDFACHFTLQTSALHVVRSAPRTGPCPTCSTLNPPGG
jgi:hypothetical protein